MQVYFKIFLIVFFSVYRSNLVLSRPTHDYQSRENVNNFILLPIKIFCITFIYYYYVIQLEKKNTLFRYVTSIIANPKSVWQICLMYCVNDQKCLYFFYNIQKHRDTQLLCNLSYIILLYILLLIVYHHAFLAYVNISSK